MDRRLEENLIFTRAAIERTADPTFEECQWLAVGIMRLSVSLRLSLSSSLRITNKFQEAEDTLALALNRLHEVAEANWDMRIQFIRDSSVKIAAPILGNRSPALL